MTGKEHYRQAERLLDVAIKESDARLIATLQLRAQVHATLALAAATELIANPPKQISLAHGGAYVTDRGTQ